MDSNVSEWIRTLVNDPSKRGLKYFLGGAYNGVYFSVTSRYPVGTNIFAKDWDLLIVLDACRVDALQEIAPEYDFISSVDSIWSVGSSSHEWLCKTFTSAYTDKINDTIYVSTNPNTPRTFRHQERPPRKYPTPINLAKWDVVDEESFNHIRQLHRHPYEQHYGTVPPDIPTDHAIELGRTNSFDKMIVHYFQPHRPYIGKAFPERRSINEIENRPIEALQQGITTHEEIWDLYLENLRIALDSVQRLLENFDADNVVITADHGELFGELGLYGHPEGIIHPNLKRVPWVRTHASDHRSSLPTVDLELQHGSKSQKEVQERLEMLGYL